jgi:hypothetical protein
MEDEELLSFSCETFALLKSPLFMSSFPSYVIFGKTFKNIKYVPGKFFKIGYFEACKVFASIVYIGSFLTSDIDSSKGVILENNQNETYFWTGITVLHNDESVKMIKLSIMQSDKIVFEVLFSVEEMNNFMYLFQRCLLSCLCLKDYEEQFILKVASESCEKIFLAKTNRTIAMQMVEDFLKESQALTKDVTSSLIELLRYYKDIIIIIKQLIAMYTVPDEITTLILAPE